jgi:hypothetical protein
MTGRFQIYAAVLLIAVALTSCQYPTGGATTPAVRTESRADSQQGVSRDLSQDEAAGGHVLRKHVGRTDDQLRERLDHERNISGASTYTDRATAEHAIGSAIAASHDRIQRWLERSGNRPNLALDYDSPQPIGRTINRGDSQSRPCSHAVVVLKYSAPGFYVLTSYPECRS